MGNVVYHGVFTFPFACFKRLVCKLKLLAILTRTTDDLLCVHSSKTGSSCISGCMVNDRIARAASGVFTIRTLWLSNSLAAPLVQW